MADYNAMKVADLRDELKRRGISSTGLSRKVQIIEAIEEDDNNAGSPANQVNESDVPTVERPAEEEEEPATEPATKDESNELTVPETEKPAETTIPKVASPAAEEASSESRKRKRGSQSPPASPDSTDTKKVKTSDDAANEVKQPDPEQIVNEVKMSDPEPQVKKTDEEVAEEAPAPVVGEVAGTEAKPDATSIPMSTSDDTKLPPEDIWKGYENEEMKKLMQKAPMQTQTAAEPPDTTNQDTEMEDASPPSVHPPTRSLYISNLVRPLQEQQLREYLTDVSQGRLTELFLDQLRTHAFATLNTLTAAARVRTALHGTPWPETTRKPLWVDYIPDDRVREWIESEKDSASSKRDAKRWEVSYQPAPTDTDLITAVLREIPTGAGQGMPNAPSGPRGASRPLTTLNTTTTTTTTITDPLPPQHHLEPSTTHLDTLFSSTTTKPKIYFRLVSTQLRDDRIKELDRETSREWLRTGGAEVGGPLDQVKRYTFEDGDRVVDGGQDFGSFGRGGGTMGGERYAPRGGSRGGGRSGRR